MTLSAEEWSLVLYRLNRNVDLLALNLHLNLHRRVLDKRLMHWRYKYLLVSGRKGCKDTYLILGLISNKK